MVGLHLLGAKKCELEKEVPRFLLAVGAGPAPLGAQEGRAESPHAAPAQPSPALLAGGEEGFCLCMGKVILTACATAKRDIC